MAEFRIAKLVSHWCTNLRLRMCEGAHLQWEKMDKPLSSKAASQTNKLQARKSYSGHMCVTLASHL